MLPNFLLLLYRRETAKSLLNVINKEFSTLPFCRRYLDRLGHNGYLIGVCIMKSCWGFGTLSLESGIGSVVGWLTAM